MAVKTKNTRIPVSPSNLSDNLVSTLDYMAAALQDSCSDDCSASIFAAARQIRITAREMNILSRFDREVNKSEFAGVFNDYDYNFTKWSNGELDPVRDPHG
jgi:hypothetical protein